jgi:hypothetical protein
LVVNDELLGLHVRVLHAMRIVGKAGRQAGKPREN